MRGLEIAPLAAADPAAFEAAFSEVGWSKPANLFQRYLREQSSGERSVLVARLDGRFAGYVTIGWTSDYPPFREARIPEVQDFNVLPPLQRRGVGAALMDAAEALAAARSPIVGIGVGLHPGYGAAQRLYVRRGYVPDGRGVAWREPGDRPYRTVEAYSPVRADDDLILFFTKQLGRQASPDAPPSSELSAEG